MIKFAGIGEPYAIGKYGVEQNSAVLQRFRYWHEGLLRAAAGQLTRREDWDLRLAMCKHLYEDAEAAEQWRYRIPELRTSSAVLSKEPDPRLSLLMDETKFDLQAFMRTCHPSSLPIFKPACRQRAG